MPDENNNGIPDGLEHLAGSLWKSRTMWLASIMGLLAVVQDYAEFLPEKYVHYAAAASAVLFALFRVQAQAPAKRALESVKSAASSEQPAVQASEPVAVVLAEEAKKEE